MTTISAGLVKELRDRTGSGMMECKKALTEAGGDIEKAIEAMRKSGQAKAAKKSARVASEGVVLIKSAADHKNAVMVEINSETDFVARDNTFNNFSSKVVALCLDKKPADVASLLALEFDAGKTVEEARTETVAKIGENIQIRRIAYMHSDGVVGAYSHGTRIGVLVQMEGGNETLAKDIAMHIAAMKPEAIDADGVSAELLQKEKEIFIAQAQESGKPMDIIEKMVQGRLQKFLKEVSLEGQPFVRDPNVTIGDLLKQAKAKVKAFIRYEVGEGIEKEETDFAAEVQAVMKGA